MRIAVVSDIHRNLPALRAVLADIERAQPDPIVNLGDIVSGPLRPAETARRAESNGRGAWADALRSGRVGRLESEVAEAAAASLRGADA